MDMRVAKLVYDDATTNVNITYYSYDASGNVMATYDRTITRTSVTATKRNYTDTYKTEELQVYGAKRLGIQLGNGTIVAATITQTISGNSDVIERMQGFSWTETNPMTFDNTKRVVNDRYYEMANHLGNVLVVVSDRKIEYNNLDYYTADVVSYSDYSPYGTLLDGRHGQQNADYRFGYQGSEKDDEIKNISGSSYTTHFRMLDPRIGRWFSTDPVFQPWQSPYTSMDNNPIMFNDPFGDSIPTTFIGSDGKSMNTIPFELQAMFQYEYGIELGYNSETKMLYMAKDLGKPEHGSSSSAREEYKTALESTLTGKAAKKEYGNLVVGYKIGDPLDWNNKGVRYGHARTFLSKSNPSRTTYLDLADFEQNESNDFIFTMKGATNYNGLSIRAFDLARTLEHEYLAHLLNGLKDPDPGDYVAGKTVEYTNKFSAEIGIPQRLNYGYKYGGGILMVFGNKALSKKEVEKMITDILNGNAENHSYMVVRVPGELYAPVKAN